MKSLVIGVASSVWLVQKGVGHVGVWLRFLRMRHLSLVGAGVLVLGDLISEQIERWGFARWFSRFLL